MTSTNDRDALRGGCLCGGIRYHIEGTPRFVAQCFCRDCQRATGTGHTTIIGVEAGNLTVTGTPTVFTSIGDTGGRVNRHFCGRCGSRLFTSGDLPGTVRMIQAGTLDFPERVAPTTAIYLKDRISWDHVDPTLQQFPGMPAAPP